MNILEKIVAHKREWVAEQQSKKSVEELKQSPYSVSYTHLTLPTILRV